MKHSICARFGILRIMQSYLLCYLCTATLSCTHIIGARAPGGGIDASVMAIEESSSSTRGHTPAAIADSAPAETRRFGFVVLDDTGTGHKVQFQVAQAIKKWCSNNATDCSFAMLLGDNVYPSGLSLDADEALRQWNDLFVQPYRDLNMPFYVVMGNHDYSYHGFGTPDWRKSAVYHDFHGKGMSVEHPRFKWLFPTVANNDRNDQDSWYQFRYAGHLFSIIDTEKILYNRHIRAQMQMFERSASQTNDSPFHFVFGHHPLFSNGIHGNAGNYGDGTKALLTEQSDGRRLLEFFNLPLVFSKPKNVGTSDSQNKNSKNDGRLCDGIDIYFNGHDHNRQLILKDQGCPTLYVISGASGKTDSLNRNDANKEPGTLWMQASAGFTHVEVDEERVTITMINQNSEKDAQVSCQIRPNPRRLDCSEKK